MAAANFDLKGFHTRYSFLSPSVCKSRKINESRGVVPKFVFDLFESADKFVLKPPPTGATIDLTLVGETTVAGRVILLHQGHVTGSVPYASLHKQN